MLCLLLLFIFVLPYFLLQTRWITQFTAPLLSQLNAPYQVDFTKLTHSFAHPFQIEIENLQIQNEHHQLIFEAKTAQFELDKLKPLSLANLNKIELNDCHFTLTHLNFTLLNTLQVNQLKIKQCNLNYEINPYFVFLQNISGEFDNWQGLTAFEQLNSPAKWAFSVQSIVLSDQNTTIPATQLLTQGFIQNERLYLTQLGLTTQWGSFFGQLNYKPEESLVINKLQFYDWHYQSTQPFFKWLSDLNQQFDFKRLEQMDWIIHDLTLTQTDLMFADFNLEKANLQLKNIAYQSRAWQLNNASLFLSAGHFNWQQEAWQHPSLQLENNQEQLYFKAQSDWQEGKVELLGDYHDHILNFKSINALNLHYNLKDSILLQPEFMSILNNFKQINIEQLTLFPSTVFYPSEQFPFEFTQLEIVGTDLSWTKPAELTGKLLLNSARGTLNKIPLLEPHLTLQFLNPEYTFSFDSHFSTEDKHSYIEINGNSALPLQASNPVKLSIEAGAVPDLILKQWFAISNYPQNASNKLELIGDWKHFTPLAQALPTQNQESDNTATELNPN